MIRTVKDLESLLETRTTALQKCESRFRNILSRNVDGVLIVDEIGVLRFLNPAAESMLGRNAEELFGHQIGFPMVIGEATEVDIFSARGRNAVAEMRVVATEWDGQPARMASLRDVTERLRLSEENSALLAKEQNLRKQLEGESTIKDQFIATVSHELRTPLTAILAWTKILQSGKLDKPTVQNGLGVIERNVKAQSRIIDDMLDVSRIINGKLTLELETVDLCKVTECAIESIEPTAKVKGVNVKQVVDLPSVLVNGDPDRLQQVFWNLLTNAIRHTPAGGDVIVHVSVSGECAIVRIEDSGEGIDPEIIPFIFDRFRQGRGATERTHRGLGLGLSIVRNIVEMHAGSVHATSKGIGRGSAFSVAVPLASSTSHVLEKSAEIPTVEHPCSGLLTGLRVLLVEDEDDLREVLAHAMRQYKVEVTAVASVQEALNALEDSNHDVLVSDIAMPVEDGYALIRKVRNQRNAIPAAALSANSKTTDVTRALDEGFQLFISKPVDPFELARSIATLARNTSGQTGR